MVINMINNFYIEVEYIVLIKGGYSNAKENRKNIYRKSFC